MRIIWKWWWGKKKGGEKDVAPLIFGVSFVCLGNGWHFKWGEGEDLCCL